MQILRGNLSAGSTGFTYEKFLSSYSRVVSSPGTLQASTIITEINSMIAPKINHASKEPPDLVRQS